MKSHHQGLVYLALLIAIVQCGLLMATQFYPSPDACVYLTLGKNLFSGHGYTYGGKPHLIFPPGYPILCGLAGSIIKSKLPPGLVVSFCLHLCGILGMAALAARITKNQLVGGAAAFVWALAGDPAIYASQALSEAAFTSGLILVSLAMSYPLDWRRGLALGALSGFLALVRPEGFIFLIAVPISIIFFIGLKQLRIGYPAASMAVAAFLIVYSPYMAFLMRHTEGSGISGKIGINLLVAQAPEENIERARFLHAVAPDGKSTLSENPPAFSVTDFIFKDFMAWLKIFGENLLTQFKHLLDATGFAALILAPIGIIFLAKRNPRALWMFLAGACCVIVDAMLRSGRRFMMPFYPGMVLAACLGAWVFIERIALKFEGKKRVLAATVAALVAAAPLCYQLQTPARKMLARRTIAGYDKPDELRAMGELAARQIPDIAKESILAAKPQVAFYAGAIDRDLPAGLSPRELADYMTRAGIKYLVLDFRSTQRSRPELLRFLLHPRNDPSFEPVAEIGGPYRAVLWKLLRPIKSP